jgi:hypothetical protein
MDQEMPLGGEQIGAGMDGLEKRLIHRGAAQLD